MQRYVVDYAITPSQLRSEVNSAGIHHGITNFMITSFDEGGVLRTSVASRAISDLKADGYKEILSGGLRLRQQVDVPGSRDVVATRSPGWTDGANGNY